MKHIACLLVLCLTPSLRAQEWTRFRGPNGTGIARADLPPAITPDRIRWKSTLPGAGHSSPVLWGGRVFIACADEKDATRIIACLDAEDGRLLWKRQYACTPFRQNRDSSFAASTPAVDDLHIYFFWNGAESSPLVALDHDGREAWRADLGPHRSQHGNGNSPIVFEDLVIIGNDQEGPESFLLAVDRRTGQTRWKTPRTSSSASACTPFIHQPPGQAPQVIFTSRNEGVAAYEARTGKLVWQISDILDRRVVASPIFAGGLIIANCGEGQAGRVLVAVAPPADGQPARKAWEVKVQAPYVPTPICVNGLLFLWTDTGTITAVLPATGEQVWQERLGSAFYSSPLAAGGRLYNTSKKGELFIIAAADRFELLGRLDLAEQCFASPAAAGQRLFIRTSTSLLCIE
jgi:outer membrane protein assembly factor BamB